MISTSGCAIVRGLGLRRGMSAALSTRCVPAFALLRDSRPCAIMAFAAAARGIFIVTWYAPTSSPISPAAAIGGPKLAPRSAPARLGRALSEVIGRQRYSAGRRPGSLVTSSSLDAIASGLAPLLAAGGPGWRLLRKLAEAARRGQGQRALLPGHGGCLDRLDGLLPVAILDRRSSQRGRPAREAQRSRSSARPARSAARRSISSTGTGSLRGRGADRRYQRRSSLAQAARRPTPALRWSRTRPHCRNFRRARWHSNAAQRRSRRAGRGRGRRARTRRWRRSSAARASSRSWPRSRQGGRSRSPTRRRWSPPAR